MRRTLPAISALVFLIVALAFGIPWLTRDRVATTGTPTPPPFSAITPIALKPGQEVCQSLVAFEDDTRTATVLSSEGVEDGPPLRVVARAGGWESAGEVAGGYGELTQLQATLDPPPRDVLGEVCVTNEGAKRVLLQATEEGRVQTRSVTEVEGEPVVPRMALLLRQGADRSLADRPGQLLERVAAFKPPIVGTWSLALLALLVVLGVPALVVFAVARGIADDE